MYAPLQLIKYEKDEMRAILCNLRCNLKLLSFHMLNNFNIHIHESANNLLIPQGKHLFLSNMPMCDVIKKTLNTASDANLNLFEISLFWSLPRLCTRLYVSKMFLLCYPLMTILNRFSIVTFYFDVSQRENKIMPKYLKY